MGWNDWIVPIQRNECLNGICHAETQLSSLQVTLYGLMGLVGIIILIFIIIKVVKFCKEFQTNFGNVDGQDRLVQQERKRLFISIGSDIGSIVLGMFDLITDISALIVILEMEQYYSSGFVILYFCIMVISSFVSSAHFWVTFQNAMEAYNQLKTGMIGVPSSKKNKVAISVEEEQFQSVASVKSIHPASGPKLSVISNTTSRLTFKLSLIEKNIKQEATTMFVGLCEDLPFFVLNLFAILSAGDDIGNELVLLLTFNGMSLGYKISVTKQFFTHLSEKAFLKQSIEDLNKSNDERERESIASIVNNAF